VGFTREVPFPPLEEKVMNQVVTAQADDAEVKLAAWSPPQETGEEAMAQPKWYSNNLRSAGGLTT
jgi:hypothetical protein